MKNDDAKPNQPEQSNQPDEAKPLKTVLLWGVKDAPGEWYEHKILAEVRARVLFPIDDPDHRYARVFFKIFYTEAE